MTPKNAPWSHRHQRPSVFGCAVTLLAGATVTLLSLGHLFTDPLPTTTVVLTGLGLL